jgi:sugar phosphate isomerase/epimerase
MKAKRGVLITYKKETDLKAEILKAQQMGLESCQLSMWDSSMFNRESADNLNETIKETGFRISALWAGWHAPCKWNFTEGPTTIGLVPVEYRASRLAELKAASDFAEMIGVNKVITHVGFIPEDPNHPDFTGVVEALRELCEYMKPRGQ